jgi:dUTP pyrophosphatase
MEIKVKKTHPDAKIPEYAKFGDAGADLTSVEMHFDTDGNVVYSTGLAFEIPLGYVGLLFARSSNAKKDLILSNCVGVLDSQFRGTVLFKYKVFGDKVYEIGDRIGQIIVLPYPIVTYVNSDNLSETDRGEGGFGSTGK